MFDTCWMVTADTAHTTHDSSTTCRAVELLNITVKKEGTKTARSASHWQAGENKEITGWMHRLPNSEAIPQVACYKYLGGEEKAQWKDIPGKDIRRTFSCEVALCYL